MHFRVSKLLAPLLLLMTACASPGIQSGSTPSPLATLAPPLATATKAAPATAVGAVTATDSSNEVTPAVVWERSGGIRGMCQKLTIWYNGTYILEDCHGNAAPVTGILSGQQMKTLNDFINRFQTFDWKFNPPQGSADMFMDQFTFYGKGTVQPSEDEKTMINELLAGFASELVVPTASPTEATTQSGESGIEGQALLGPACPGPVRADQPCPDKPYQGAFKVLNQAGEQVGQFQTGPDGRFHLALPPGTYTVHPDTGAVYPLAQDQTVTVQSGQFSEVNVTFDSGIR